MSSRFHRAHARVMILGGLVALVTLVGSLVAHAAPTPKVCFYFSDDTRTELVGAHGRSCTGEVVDWGDTSPYKYCQLLHCPD